LQAELSRAIFWDEKLRVEIDNREVHGGEK
jgi:hypothetical protein